MTSYAATIDLMPFALTKDGKMIGRFEREADAIVVLNALQLTIDTEAGAAMPNAWDVPVYKVLKQWYDRHGHLISELIGIAS